MKIKKKKLRYKIRQKRSIEFKPSAFQDLKDTLPNGLAHNGIGYDFYTSDSWFRSKNENSFIIQFRAVIKPRSTKLSRKPLLFIV